jgi:hypothetical protein
MPHIFDVIDVLSDAELIEVGIDRRHHRESPLGEGRATKPVEPGFGRFHLYDDEVGALWCGSDGFHTFDLHRCHAFRICGFCIMLPGMRTVGGAEETEQSSGRSGSQHFQSVTAILARVGSIVVHKFLD